MKIDKYGKNHTPFGIDQKPLDNKTNTKCYLTTACMKNGKHNHDVQCYQLDILRWFQEHFVSKEEIEHYYEVAPTIIREIEESGHEDILYQYIYDNIVLYCVRKIEEENFEEAYSRYTNGILALEKQFAIPELNQEKFKKFVVYIYNF
jgi:hypothetical protein